MTHIAEDFVRRAEGTPTAPFLIDEKGRVYTYGDVALRARRLAGSLRERNVAAGDRVLLLLSNGVDYLASYYGTLLVGATAVGIQPRTPTRALAHVVSNCEPKLCIAEAEREDLADVGVETIASPDDLAGGAPYENAPIGGDRDIAQIIYTSGTTGKPKGVMLSHSALSANTSGIVEYLGLDASDRVGVVLDFVYSYGNSLLQTHCRVGGSLALLGPMTFPVRVVDRLQERSCTGISGVPSTFALLLSRGRLERRPLPHLRYLTCAGGPLPKANLRRLRDLLPSVDIFLMYGQTEASARLSYLPLEELERRPGSIGKGMPGVVLEVRDSRNRRVSPGEEGEIVASGENLMSGYWDDPEGTSQTLREGELWTGDLATVDEEGFIFITGRRSDLIKTGAYRVHPKEIEDAIVSLDGVHECVVVGVPDETWGEVVVACFPRDSAPTVTEIRKHLRGRLPDYKWPRAVAEVDTIPRTASGKPRRRELAERISEPASDDVRVSR